VILAALLAPRRDAAHPALVAARGGAVLRVDDYPTGVRTVEVDLGPLHRFLELLDARGLPYHLGIVPALLTDEMARRLAALRHMTPVVHGHDHGYPRHGPALAAAGDPRNARDSVRPFDEFAGLDEREIAARLVRGRALLEARFGVPVTGYIPPCNRAGPATGRALAAAGFTHYFSERRIPACRLPGLASDFYGRSDSFRPRRRAPRVVTLHATWEADLVREGDERSLARLLDRLAAPG